MKKVGKPVFFIVAILIFALAYTSIFGIYGENGDFKITYIKGVSDISGESTLRVALKLLSSLLEMSKQQQNRCLQQSLL